MFFSRISEFLSKTCDEFVCNSLSHYTFVCVTLGTVFSCINTTLAITGTEAEEHVPLFLVYVSSGTIFVPIKGSTLFSIFDLNFNKE